MLQVSREQWRKLVTPSGNFSTIKITTDGGFKTFYAESKPRQMDLLICPTGALQLSASLIDRKTCIQCLLCCFTSPAKLIKFTEEADSLNQFMDYCADNLDFVTRWVAILLSASDSHSKIGLEVKIEGGSREKRIPLLSMTKGNAVIWKVARSHKDVERAGTVLNDISDLAIEGGFSEPLKIVLVLEPENNYKHDNRAMAFLKQKTSELNFKVVSVEYVWNMARHGIEEQAINWERDLFQATDRILFVSR